ncbi:FCD domain-containing protein [Nocardia sp. NPDC050630]|uniref:FCD domain-containing protein n=1 Tax=Nocardia sp. NPDC050630 TaxID=3364321 RepID=UPI00378DFE10
MCREPFNADSNGPNRCGQSAPEDRPRATRSVEAVLVAVRKRDPQAARDAMREHLHHVRRVLLGNNL